MCFTFWIIFRFHMRKTVCFRNLSYNVWYFESLVCLFSIIIRLSPLNMYFSMQYDSKHNSSYFDCLNSNPFNIFLISMHLQVFQAWNSCKQNRIENLTIFFAFASRNILDWIRWGTKSAVWCWSSFEFLRFVCFNFIWFTFSVYMLIVLLHEFEIFYIFLDKITFRWSFYKFKFQT